MFPQVRNCNGNWSLLFAELVGPKQLWLGALRQAVAQGREEWLARFLPGQQTGPVPLCQEKHQPQHRYRVQWHLNLGHGGAELGILQRE